jgi:transposase
MVLLSDQGMDVTSIARVAFASEGHVRDVIHNFNSDGFDALFPRYCGGRPPEFTLPQSRGTKEDRKVEAGRAQAAALDPEPVEAGEFLVAEGVVDDISHEGLRTLLREEGVTFSEDVEGRNRPRVRSEEGPHRASAFDRRRRGGTARS